MSGPARATFSLDDPRLPGALRRPAVTVGVFDGVHRGHQAMLATLCAWAAEGGVDPAVVTFREHPRTVLGSAPVPLLTSLDHRLLLLERAGARGVLLLDFDDAMAAWEPEEFVLRVFVQALGASRVLVGANHRFGHGRRGDLALLQAMGREHGFEARELELTRAEEVISSTAIRQALAQGDLARAEVLLGRPVSVLGEVVPGDQRGRTLGFPTANLNLHHAARPARGVYAAQARAFDPTSGAAGPLRPAVVNVGRRPTFHPEQGEDLVEVHLLDGPCDLYGRTLEVLFRARLRDERRFPGPDALRAQIEADAAQARDLLDRA